MILYIIRFTLIVILSILSVITDMKDKKIPNSITFTGVIAGIVLTAVCCPKQLLITIPIIIALFFFGMLNLIGLGDIKLFMAIAAIGGWHAFCIIFVTSIFACCLYGLIRYPIYMGFYMQKLLHIVKNKGYTFNKRISPKIIFAWFILIGTLINYLVFEPFSPLYVFVKPYLLF